MADLHKPNIKYSMSKNLKTALLLLLVVLASFIAIVAKVWLLQG
jgi:hypothetical protein